MTPYRHILVADDDLEDRYMMLECFKELCHNEHVTFAEDGTILLQQMRGMQPDVIGLVVLDLNMPRMGGKDTLQVIKNDDRYKHIQVVIFSTSINEIERAICMELGAVAYITKPAKWSEYVATCKLLCDMASHAPKDPSAS